MLFRKLLYSVCIFSHENINPRFDNITQPRKKGDRGKMGIYSSNFLLSINTRFYPHLWVQRYTDEKDEATASISASSVRPGDCGAWRLGAGQTETFPLHPVSQHGSLRPAAGGLHTAAGTNLQVNSDVSVVFLRDTVIFGYQNMKKYM